MHRTMNYNLVFAKSDVLDCMLSFRSPGRIVEALVEDFMALVGSGMLTVTVQNTGHTTADYSVSNSTLIHCTTAV